MTTVDLSDKAERVKELMNNLIPFHKTIGLEATHVDLERVEMSIKMRQDLVGNPFQRILHGGLIATVLDATGGMLALMHALNALGDNPSVEAMEQLKDLGTIDLRIDYLRPGRGESFVASAYLIRAGSRVSVARMELHNEEGKHIALGTGTYIVG